MKKIKQIISTVLLLGILFLGYFTYINLRIEKEPLPEISNRSGTEPNYHERQWWESTTVYQIYPRSFQDSNGDGIGDITGIISRLDYLQWLGFETIWCSPFFESPQGDFGYDVSDYYRIDPVYGDSMLVDSLIREVHRRDMKIVFDLVLNHTSDQHPWFQESRSGADNPKSDWYVWRKGENGNPPNNWHSLLTTPGWNYEPKRNQWYYAAFLPFQPDLNWRNPEVKATMFEVVRYWLDQGVDGFRLDIFNFIYEDAQFRNNPFTLRYLPNHEMTKVKGQHRVHNMNHPDNFQLARELRQILDQYDNPSRFMVGEVFGSHSTLKQFLGTQRDGLNLVFLFDITDFRWEADFFRKKIRRFEAFYPYPYQPTYVFSNHDRPRSISRLDNDMEKAKLLALLQLTLRGVPFTYQGEEIGMPTAEILLEEAKDPVPAVLLSTLPGFIGHHLPFIFNRDNCRTPMQWTGRKNAGFTTADTPWLPVTNGFDTINMERQQQQQNSLLQTYRSLLHLRQESLPLKWGSLQVLEKKEIPANVLAYRRTYQDEQVSIYVNFSNQPKIISEQGAVLFSIGTFHEDNGQFTLGGNSGLLIRK